MGEIGYSELSHLVSVCGVSSPMMNDIIQL